jgi:hypothetical protein
MTCLPAPAARRPLPPASGVGGGLREAVARRHGRRRNPARTTPRSSLRPPTNQAHHSPQTWCEKVGRSIKGSDTPHIAYRRFAKGLHTAYRNQTPDTIRDYLIDGIGELRFTPGHIEVRLRRRTHTPALLEAGYQDKRVQVPWWGNRTLTYSFPAR